MRTSWWEGFDNPIESLELFRLDVETPRHFSHGTWRSRQHAFLRAGSGGHAGWSEGFCGINQPDIDLEEWGAPLAELRSRSIADAVRLLRERQGVWPTINLEMAELALLDLAGRLQGRSALELLGLSGRDPVTALFCILEREPDKAAERARVAVDRGLGSRVKLKLFGKPSRDRAIVAAVREVLGQEAYILGDANRGYTGRWGGSVELLAQQLTSLLEAGLDGCEDPAELPNEDWARLQQLVEDLDLIADYPTRAVWNSAKTLIPGMAIIHSLHPGCLGSIEGAIEVAGIIGGFESHLMVGDDSFIGAGCTIWQQLAIGLGAVWVEAIEKADESDEFLSCMTAQATAYRPDGLIGLAEDKPIAGFGLEVDTARLRDLAVDYRRW